MKQILIRKNLRKFRHLRRWTLFFFCFCIIVVIIIVIIFDADILQNTHHYTRYIITNGRINNQNQTKEQFVRLNANQLQKFGYNIIIYWTGYPPYDNSYHNLNKPKFCYQKYPKCLITSNRVYLKQSGALIFNWRDFDQFDLPSTRSENQLWTLYNLEPPPHIKRLPEDNDKTIFNLTATYRHDSRIYQPYGIITRRKIPLQESDPRLNVDPSHKSKLVSWFVSNCRTQSRREDYVRLLSRFIQVDIYGKCGPFKCDRFGQVDCYKFVARNYKFYLSFENSFCTDYVTEKLFYILSYDLVPVVYGDANYSSILPPNSFIDASTMRPHQLAQLLVTISRDKDKYRSYFAWRQYYFVDKRTYTELLYCKLCQLIANKQIGPIRNRSKINPNSFTTKQINSWFIDSACNATKPDLLISQNFLATPNISAAIRGQQLSGSKVILNQQFI